MLVIGRCLRWKNLLCLLSKTIQMNIVWVMPSVLCVCVCVCINTDLGLLWKSSSFFAIATDIELPWDTWQFFFRKIQYAVFSLLSIVLACLLLACREEEAKIICCFFVLYSRALPLTGWETTEKMFILCSVNRVQRERKKWQAVADRQTERKENERIYIENSKQQPLPPHRKIWDEKNHFLRRQRCRNKKHIPVSFSFLLGFRFCITRFFK